MYCPKCGKENPDDAQLCQSCSSVLTSIPAQVPALGPKTSGLAIAALVLGILSIFFFPVGLIAIILGIVSIVIIEKSGGRLTGRGFATVGIVIPVLMFFLIITLLALLMPALARTREQVRRTVCLNNLKQLSLAWIMYADENDDRIVNGAAGSERAGELPWVGKDWSTDYQDEKREMLVNGVLFPYCMTVKLYRCPAGLQGHMRTYSIVDSMNGIAGEGLDEIPGLHIKKRMEIRKPGNRVVFIDVGQVIPDTYSVYYDQQKWWDEPPVRHADGTSVSFADGHADYWKWRAAETVDHGKAATSVHSPKAADHWSPQTSKGREDLQRMQKGCWGRLGY